MSYELKDYLNAINFTKKNLMDSEDKLWQKKQFFGHRIPFYFAIKFFTTAQFIKYTSYVFSVQVI